METLLMSVQERKRMVILNAVGNGGMSLAQAAEAMGICYRQAKRVRQRFKQSGEAGLVHRSRGRAGSRRKEVKLRERAVARYASRYPDFGPTLAAEKLEQEGLKVDHETLRRWLIEGGLWRIGRKRQRHRAWRERKECFGQMVQSDGSHHDWFEGRRDKAVLMVMIDDATNHTMARFSEEETTEAAYDLFEQWVREHGVPASLYVDRDSIYRCERSPSIAEQVAQKEPQTQFGRAMGQLGVELILANSPQAKGRVERCNGLLQDRLVKELRLAQISDLGAANEFLRKQFLPDLNRRFRKEARSATDAHRRNEWKLAEVLSWEDRRVVGNDWTVAWQGRWFQIDRQHEALNLAGRPVLVRRHRSGRVELLHGGRKLRMRELPARVVRTAPAPRRIGRTHLQKPSANHPWKAMGIATGEKFWRKIESEGQRRKAARADAAAASAAPPLRSGFATAAAA
jgi:molybdenum-dependent DNA-binding transcriptional regulator ModE